MRKLLERLRGLLGIRPKSYESGRLERESSTAGG